MRANDLCVMVGFCCCNDSQCADRLDEMACETEYRRQREDDVRGAGKETP